QNVYQSLGFVSHYREGHSGSTASGEAYDPKKATAAHDSLPFGTQVRVTDLKTGKSVLVRINDRSPIVTGNIIDLSLEPAKDLGIVGKRGVEVSVTEVGKAPAQPAIASNSKKKSAPRQEPKKDDKRDGIFKRLIPVSADAANRAPQNQPPPQTTARQLPQLNNPQPGREPFNPAEDGQSMNQPVLRVQFGAYRDARNAEADLRILKQRKIDAVIVQHNTSSYPYRIVTSGVFFDEAAADSWLAWLKNQPGFNFRDAFIIR
ncbi:MAG: septal ring lytic transglycosylase RlpA family protein, partial [Verrucomicrobiota bacterium]